MGKLLERFQHRKNLRARPDRGVSFPNLDARALATELKIKEKALRAGQDNLPPADSEGLDKTEQSIRQRVREEYQRTQILVYEYLHERKKDRDVAATHLKPSTLTILAPQTQSKLRKCVHDYQGELRTLGADANEAHRNLKFFQSRHNLTDRAHYPESQILGWALLFCLVTFETVVNGSFLKVAETFGLLGVISLAIFISIINVGLSYIVGRGALTSMNHRSRYRKVLGWSAFLIYLPMILVGNLLVGHFRTRIVEATSTEEVREAGFDALRTAMQDPLDLEFRSVLLIAIGLIFALIALIDGYKIDDRYPHYGVMDRRDRDTRQALRAKQQELINEVNGIFDDATNKLDVLYESGKKALNDWKWAIEDTEGVFEQFEQWVHNLEIMGNTLLAQYRNINSQIRDEPSPKHFGEKLTFPETETTSSQAFRAISQDVPSFNEKTEQIKKMDREFNDAWREESNRLSEQRQPALDMLTASFDEINTDETLPKKEYQVKELRVIEGRNPPRRRNDK